MKASRLAFAFAVTIAASGCATITSSETQTVMLNTKSADGQAVDKARCTLKNDKGTWEATSPSNVAIRRSSEDLHVECKKDGIADGFLRAISRAANGMWGNIIFGGGVGAIIDHNKGTGYDYPNELPVKMGAATVIDRRDEPKKQADQATTTASNEVQTVK